MPDHHNIVESKQQDFKHQNIENGAAKGVSYYTPAQNPPSGTASDPQPNGSHPPKLFQPLKLRGLTMQNRIMVRLHLLMPNQILKQWSIFREALPQVVVPLGFFPLLILQKG